MNDITLLLVMIDMSSAFDHAILLNRLSKSLSFRNNVFDRFNSYLNDRFQSV